MVEVPEKPKRRRWYFVLAAVLLFLVLIGRLVFSDPWGTAQFEFLGRGRLFDVSVLNSDGPSVTASKDSLVAEFGLEERWSEIMDQEVPNLKRHGWKTIEAIPGACSLRKGHENLYFEDISSNQSLAKSLHGKSVWMLYMRPATWFDKVRVRMRDRTKSKYGPP